MPSHVTGTSPDAPDAPGHSRTARNTGEGLACENRTQAHVTWLRGQLIELGEPAIGGPWWQLYGQERDRLVVVCKAMLAADVQGRLQAVAKETAEQFRYALEAITDALNLSPAQRAMLPEVVPRVLSLVTMPDGDDDGPPRGA